MRPFVADRMTGSRLDRRVGRDTTCHAEFAYNLLVMMRLFLRIAPLLRTSPENLLCLDTSNKHLDRVVKAVEAVEWENGLGAVRLKGDHLLYRAALSFLWSYISWPGWLKP